MFLKLLIVAFILGWLYLGGWMIVRYNRLFGPHKDDPAETPGARSYGVGHIVAVWVGSFALAWYFLLK